MSLVQGAQCIQTNGVTNRGNGVTFFGEKRLAFTLSRLFLQGFTGTRRIALPEFLNVIHLHQTRFTGESRAAGLFAQVF